MRERKALRKFRVKADQHWVVIQWTKHTKAPVRIAVLRSDSDFAKSAAEVFEDHPTQTLIYEGDGTKVQDQGVIPLVKYHYTSFARVKDGPWLRQHTDHVKVPKPLIWAKPSAIAVSGGEGKGAFERLRLSMVSGVGFSPGSGN